MRRDLLKSFLEVGVQLTQTLDIERVLTSIVERSMQLTEARYGAAVTLAEDGEISRFLHRGLTEEEVARLPHYPEGKGLLGLVLTDRTNVRVDAISEHSASVGFPDKHVPMKAFLGVPMILRDDLVGAIYLTKTPDQPSFTEEDEEVVSAMAAMAAVGVVNASLFAAEKERAERTLLLRDIGSRVRRTLDVSKVVSATVEVLGRAAGVERCFVRLKGPGDHTSAPGKIQAEWDAPGVEPLAPDSGRRFPVESLAVQTRRTQSSNDVTTDERLLDEALPGSPEDLLAHSTRAVLVSPLAWGEELLGVVTFHSEAPRRWTQSDIALIEAAAREVSIALHHARLYREAVNRAEELSALDELRSDFISMVSHELRSPMTVIAGIADLLQNRFKSLTDDQREELTATLGREARRLAKLVSEVLDLEAIDQGEIALELSKIDLALIAREAVTDAGQADRTELIVSPGNTIVVADGDRIKQVLLNLVSNAAKFSQGKITIQIAPDSDVVTVCVEDVGPGIPPEDISRLFERFTRIGTGRRKPGSGLGLYLSKMIVENHGGEIWVESEVGAGSKFFFRLHH